VLRKAAPHKENGKYPANKPDHVMSGVRDHGRRESYRSRLAGTLIAVKRTPDNTTPDFVVISQGGCMNFKQLLVVAVAGAFALPVAAQQSADSDRMILAQGPSGTSAVGNGPTGGTPSPQSAGEPKAPMAGERSTAGGTAKHANRGAPDFSAIDKNGDGMISRSEWDAYHRSGAAASGGATASPSATTTPPPRGKAGSSATAGDPSSRAPSSDTATSPSTSGAGKAQ
jgi:hypothetical protein